MTNEELDVLEAHVRGEPLTMDLRVMELKLLKAVPALVAALREVRAERDAFMALDASYREQINQWAIRTNQAFRRGVEAMREAATKAVGNTVGCSHTRCWSCPSDAAKIQALPDPEDKP